MAPAGPDLSSMRGSARCRRWRPAFPPARGDNFVVVLRGGGAAVAAVPGYLRVFGHRLNSTLTPLDRGADLVSASFDTTAVDGVAIGSSPSLSAGDRYMPDRSELPRRHFPCDECPIRADNRDNPKSKFSADRWEELSASVRDPLTGHQPMPGDILFGCHKGEPGTGADLACAGWLAQFGGDHVGGPAGDSAGPAARQRSQSPAWIGRRCMRTGQTSFRHRRHRITDRRSVPEWVTTVGLSASDVGFVRQL